MLDKQQHRPLVEYKQHHNLQQEQCIQYIHHGNVYDVYDDGVSTSFPFFISFIKIKGYKRII
jgi:hypothetical protein